MKQIIIVTLILLVYISPALADIGFSDFIPEDPFSELKEAGVLDLVLKILWLVVWVVVVAVVFGLIIGKGKAALHTAGNNSVGRTDAFAGMFYIVGAVVVMVVLWSVFDWVWRML